MKKFLMNLITSNTGVSSKRVAGLAGWVVVLFIGVWCTIKVIQAPTVTNEILWGSVTLLGTDAVTKIWRNKQNNQEDGKTTSKTENQNQEKS